MEDIVEEFCRDHDFVFHEHGHGFMGRERYWTFCKVINNDAVDFSLEYYPESHIMKVEHQGRMYKGDVCSLEEMNLVLTVCKIEESEICKH